MTKANFLRVSLNHAQFTQGLWYLLFETVFLQSLLNALNWILPVPMDDALRNFLFCVINFTAVILIFRQYLVQFFQVEAMDYLKTLAVSAVFFCIYKAAFLGMTWLITVLEPSYSNANDTYIIQLIRDQYFLMFTGTVILVPVAEETLFRGVLFRGLYEHSAPAAWILSTTVFCLIHILSYLGQGPWILLLSFLQYLPAGLCLAAAYRLSGSILSPILIHMAVNATGMLALR